MGCAFCDASGLLTWLTIEGDSDEAAQHMRSVKRDVNAPAYGVCRRGKGDEGMVALMQANVDLVVPVLRAVGAKLNELGTIAVPCYVYPRAILEDQSVEVQHVRT